MAVKTLEFWRESKEICQPVMGESFASYTPLLFKSLIFLPTMRPKGLQHVSAESEKIPACGLF